jgi:hypothetical protein
MEEPDLSDFLTDKEVLAEMANGLFASTINWAIANGGPDVSSRTQKILSLRRKVMHATTKEELAEIEKEMEKYSCNADLGLKKL